MLNFSSRCWVKLQFGQLGCEIHSQLVLENVVLLNRICAMCCAFINLQSQQELDMWVSNDEEVWRLRWPDILIFVGRSTDFVLK